VDHIFETFFNLLIISYRLKHYYSAIKHSLFHTVYCCRRRLL